MDGSGNNSLTNNVAAAIAAALDWSSTPESREAALSYLESTKSGDILFLANTCFLLVKKDWSPEIRLYAFKMLQHLVRLRWEELNAEEHRNFANVAVSLMSEIANSCAEWALKSQTAGLVAEIVRREGLTLWRELLPSLVSLSGSGPIQAELVSMTLRWLAEDVKVHNSDLEGDSRRLLLRGLIQSSSEVLPLLYTLLERHLGAALSEAGKQQMDIAEQHAAAVTATLNAVNAYAEWASLTDLAKYGIIHGCGSLLTSLNFRLHACEFFKLVLDRKRPIDTTTSDYDSAISTIFQVLINFSREVLARSGSSSGALDETEVEFGEFVCESLASLGSSNLQCISGDTNMLPIYLQQMLGYFQHFKFSLHFQSLLFWLELTRKMLSKPNVTVHPTHGAAHSNVGASSGQAEDDKKNILRFMDDEICAAILDVCFQRRLKRENVSSGTTPNLGALELRSDDFEGKGDFRQYRSNLMKLVSSIACYKPLIASAKLTERIKPVIKSFLHSPPPAQVDTMIILAINLLDDLDMELNIYGKKVREWYGWHFPKLTEIIHDDIIFAKVVRLMGNRENAARLDFSQVLSEEVEAELKEVATTFTGTEVMDLDFANIIELCDSVIALGEFRVQLYDYLKSRMNVVAPNLTALVGDVVGARFIVRGGSLLNLAKQPGSTLQILGAEKALFRALKTKKATPKHGLIYHASLVNQARRKFKGKISRSLAAKMALVIRCDVLGDNPDNKLGLKSRAQLEARLRNLEARGEKSKIKADDKDLKKAARTYNPAEDSVLGKMETLTVDEEKIVPIERKVEEK